MMMVTREVLLADAHGRLAWRETLDDDAAEHRDRHARHAHRRRPRRGAGGEEAEGGAEGTGHAGDANGALPPPGARSDGGGGGPEEGGGAAAAAVCLFEPRLWSLRSLAPCFYLCAHPLLALAALDGEVRSCG